MSRVISTGDLHNVVTRRKMEYGKLAALVDNIVEEMVGETPTANVIPISEGATNGEMIQIIFNCMVIEVSKRKVYVEHIFFPFDEEWWNAPYKGVKNESSNT